MAGILGLLSLVALVATALLLMRAVRPRGYVEAALWYALFLSALIVVLGYTVSELHVLSDLRWWTVGSLLVCAATVLVCRSRPALRAACFRPLQMPRRLETVIQQADKTQFSTRVLIGLAIIVALVALGNFILILGAQPSTYDVVSYHISRIGFYLQANTLNYYDTNFWAEVAHPKIATVLMLYAYLVLHEAYNMMALVQYGAYLLTMVALYGITRHLGASRQGSLFAALLFSLLTIVIAEAATGQNDMVMTAFIAGTVYGCVAYRQTRALRYLVLAALAFALAAGVKSSVAAFVLPLALIAGWAVWPTPTAGKAPARHIGIALLALVLWGCVLTLPSGYLGNLQHYGHPVGTAAMRKEHAFEGRSAGDILRYGGMNVVRYAIEFTGLDGLPPMFGFDTLHQRIMHHWVGVAATVGLNVATEDGGRRVLGENDPIACSEDRSFWGILGVLLIWPVVLWTLLAPGRPGPARLFALAAVISFLAQAYMSPYDWYRGRYFITTAIFALPALGFIFPPRARVFRAALAAVLILGGISAFSATVIRQGTLMIPINVDGAWYSTLLLDRMSQLTRQAPDFNMLPYFALVPEDGTVAIDSTREIPNLFFFGDSFSRTLVPISPYNRPPHSLPIPDDADALIYDDESPYRRPGDIVLVQSEYATLGTLYLRILHPTEEQAPYIVSFGGDPALMAQPSQ